MKTYRYTLEKFKDMKTRYQCPNCEHRKTFSHYIDTETGEHVHPNVGRCNRENECRYHYTPKQYFQDNNISMGGNLQYNLSKNDKKLQTFSNVQKPVSYIPTEVFSASLSNYDKNHFVHYLKNLFGAEVTTELVSRYFIGTSNYWARSTVFWQVDAKGRIRTGKIMLYSPATGKRVKEPFNYIGWAHKALKLPEFELSQCLFGEHLLKDKRKPVAIVESEKSAIIACVYLPQFIWVAVGGLANLNSKMCHILKGRNVVLFPDLKGYEKWSCKAKELTYFTSLSISDLLEREATEAERKQGLDIADYLVRFKLTDFVLPDHVAPAPPPEVQPLVEVKRVTPIEKTYGFIKLNSKPENWDNDIIELENFFNGIVLPDYPIQLKQGEKLINVSKFLESHFITVKADNGNPMPCFERLKRLKSILESTHIHPGG